MMRATMKEISTSERLECRMIEAGIVAAIRDRLTTALAPPPGNLRPLRVDGHVAGWLDARRCTRALRFADVFRESEGGIVFAPELDTAAVRTQALDRVARTLASEGALSAWRNERYAVAPEFGAPPWFELERAAARYFGVRTFAAHVNGLVREGGAVEMWFARRSPEKAIDPGLLDNLVGGGIAAGTSVAATVVKEAREEAGIAEDKAATAAKAGTVHVCRLQPEGVQRETVFVHDLWLPRDFTPQCRDGEAVAHRRVDLATAARLIAHASGPDVVTADASLVVLDWLMREGGIPRASSHFAALDALRSPDTSRWDEPA
jgi:8-oxo-dGTP pyrophosphatase MutT (NUDIX family)